MGVAYAMTAKGEDCFIASVPEAGTCTFGVFDGHNGKRAAVHCRDVMCPKLVVEGPPYTLRKLSDAFWDADRALGLSDTTDGTTASLLLVDRSEDLGTFLCTLGWVGDSTVVRLDMVGENKVLFKTTTHRAVDPAEVARMELNWSVRKHLAAQRGGDAGSGLALQVDRNIDLESRALQSTASAIAPTEQEIAAAVAKLGLEGQLKASGMDASVLQRALEREILMELPERRRRLERVNSSLVARLGVVGSAPSRVCGGRKRQLTDDDKVAISKLARQDSAAVLRDIEESWKGNKFGEVTTSVSRSIGDWDAARVLIPQPEVLSFTLDQGGWERIVLASDGLWDCCTLAEATSIACDKSASPLQAADRLVKKVAKPPGGRAGGPMDDVTVVVVDLDLTGNGPAAKLSTKPHRISRMVGGGGGCVCSIQ